MSWLSTLFENRHSLRAACDDDSAAADDPLQRGGGFGQARLRIDLHSGGRHRFLQVGRRQVGPAIFSIIGPFGIDDDGFVLTLGDGNHLTT